ncbi:MAG TPA: hypothetical protein VH325_18870 [Bryobacteraceae bacterium]|jgi:hypothetical protein|nr:hypothetical protein [Bryobacteraceae bacterium]
MFDLLKLLFNGKPKQDPATHIASVTPEGRTIVDTQKLFRLEKTQHVMDLLASRQVEGVRQIVITGKK